MRVIKHGEGYEEIEFKCKKCKCEFVALKRECETHSFTTYKGVKTKEASCYCPECGNKTFSYRKEGIE